ncbi:MAG: hypothetical protein ABIG96_01515 [Candidatus Micrarchaeota archaeon]
MSTLDDRYCASTSGGWNYDWNIDGYQCTDVVRDSQQSSGTTAPAGNDVVCGCDSGGKSCDSTDAGNNADGICASNACTSSGIVMNSSQTFTTGCANGGYVCDSAIQTGGTPPQYVRDGFCVSTTCCTSAISSSEASSPDWTDSDNSCGCASAGDICDNTPATGVPLSSEGICASSTCATSGTVRLNAGTYSTGCASGNECDSDITSPSLGYTRNGYCAGATSTCATTAIVASSVGTDECGTLTTGCSAGVFTDADSDDGCDTGNEGSLCDSTPATGPTAGGVCVEDSCRTSGIIMVNCGTSCTNADLTDANMAVGCTSTSGDSCDDAIQGSGFGQTGTCTSSGCTTSGAIGKSGSTYYAGCAAGRECDSGATGGDYARDGYCAQSTCTTSLIVASTTGSDECGSLSGCSATDWGGNDETNSCASAEGAICDTTAASGPADEGTCVDGSCRTSGATRLNCGTDGCANTDIASGMVYSCDDTSGDACDDSIDGSGFVQTGICAANACDTSGHVCYTGAAFAADCSSCSESNACDSTITSGGDYNADGVCAATTTCCTGFGSDPTDSSSIDVCGNSGDAEQVACNTHNGYYCDDVSDHSWDTAGSKICAVTGESDALGGYTAYQAEGECCGDDGGENIRNTSMGETFYLACCSAATDCVNSTGACIADTASSEGYLCNAGTWELSASISFTVFTLGAGKSNSTTSDPSVSNPTEAYFFNATSAYHALVVPCASADGITDCQSGMGWPAYEILNTGTSTFDFYMHLNASLAGTGVRTCANSSGTGGVTNTVSVCDLSGEGNWNSTWALWGTVPQSDRLNITIYANFTAAGAGFRIRTNALNSTTAA